MPKPKWNLNTIYISERLQESLRPISRCAMTTVVAPMGYGKTTAVNWYLGEHGGDPSSVEFCHNVGLDYVSCSPYRVPFARLAAAQAAIKAPRAK